jgi:hypothetical protein
MPLKRTLAIILAIFIIAVVTINMTHMFSHSHESQFGTHGEREIPHSCPTCDMILNVRLLVESIGFIVTRLESLVGIYTVLSALYLAAEARLYNNLIALRTRLNN